MNDFSEFLKTFFYFYKIQLYDLSNGVFVHTYNGHSSWLTSVHFSQTNLLVTSSADGICNVSSLYILSRFNNEYFGFLKYIKVILF